MNNSLDSRIADLDNAISTFIRERNEIAKLANANMAQEDPDKYEYIHVTTYNHRLIHKAIKYYLNRK